MLFSVFHSRILLTPRTKAAWLFFGEFTTKNRSGLYTSFGAFNGGFIILPFTSFVFRRTTEGPPRMICTSHMWTPHDDLFISATYVQTLWKFKQYSIAIAILTCRSAFVCNMHPPVRTISCFNISKTSTVPSRCRHFVLLYTLMTQVMSTMCKSLI